MFTPEELRIQRSLADQAEMQKLSVARNFLLALGEVCQMNIFDGPHVKTPNSFIYL